MDEILKQAIEKELIQKPKTGFTDQVMNQIFELKKVKVYEPIISKRVWSILVVASVMALMLLVFSPSGNAKTTEVSWLEKGTQYFEQISVPDTSAIADINFLPLALFSLVIFLLLVFDSYLLRKKQASKK